MADNPFQDLIPKETANPFQDLVPKAEPAREQPAAAAEGDEPALNYAPVRTADKKPIPQDKTLAQEISQEAKDVYDEPLGMDDVALRKLHNAAGPHGMPGAGPIAAAAQSAVAGGMRGLTAAQRAAAVTLSHAMRSAGTSDTTAEQGRRALNMGAESLMADTMGRAPHYIPPEAHVAAPKVAAVPPPVADAKNVLSNIAEGKPPQAPGPAEAGGEPPTTPPGAAPAAEVVPPEKTVAERIGLPERPGVPPELPAAETQIDTAPAGRQEPSFGAPRAPMPETRAEPRFTAENPFQDLVPAAPKEPVIAGRPTPDVTPKWIRQEDGSLEEAGSGMLIYPNPEGGFDIDTGPGGVLWDETEKGALKQIDDLAAAGRATREAQRQAAPAVDEWKRLTAEIEAAQSRGEEGAVERLTQQRDAVNQRVNEGAPSPVAEPAPPPRQESAPTGEAKFTTLTPDQLNVDPRTYQYKESDEKGVTGALSAAKRWEPDLANPITVHQRLNGEHYVVNGHQRADLAKRAQQAGQENIQIPARVYREAEGYTPQDMKVLGALQNMAEGSGTAMDAARVLRSIDRGTTTRRLPEMNAKTQQMLDGKGLAALSDEAFKAVENDVLPPAFAARVGELIKDPAEQMATIDALARAEPANAEQARFMVEDIKNQGFLKGKETSLFGEEDFAKSLIAERARILDNAKRTLRESRAVFKTATDQEGTLAGAGNVMSREANLRAKAENERLIDTLSKDASRKGPVSDLLTSYAGELAAGKHIGSLTPRFLTGLREVAARETGQTLGRRDHGPGADAAREGETGQESGLGLAEETPDQALRRQPATEKIQTIDGPREQYVLPGAEQKPGARPADKARIELGMRGKKTSAKPQASTDALPLFGGGKDLLSGLESGARERLDTASQAVSRAEDGQSWQASTPALRGKKFASYSDAVKAVRQELFPYRDQNQHFEAWARDKTGAPQELARDYLLERGRATDHEFIAVYDPHTGAIDHVGTTGEKDFVALPHATVDRLMDPDARLNIHHNHGRDSALSGPDMLMTVAPGVDTVVAYGHGGGFSAARLGPLLAERATPGNLIATQNTMNMMHADALAQAANRLRQYVREGQIAPDVADKMAQDIAARALQATGAIDYLSNHGFGSLPPKIVKDIVRDVAGKAMTRFNDLTKSKVSLDDGLLNRSTRSIFGPDDAAGFLATDATPRSGGPGREVGGRPGETPTPGSGRTGSEPERPGAEPGADAGRAEQLRLPGVEEGAKPPKKYEIFDRHTGKVVGDANTRHGAGRSVDRRDNEYGAYRYGHRVNAEWQRLNEAGEAQEHPGEIKRQEKLAKLREDAARDITDLGDKIGGLHEDPPYSAGGGPTGGRNWRDRLTGFVATRGKQALDTLGEIKRDIQLKTAPMALGSAESRAAVKDFANGMRVSRWHAVRMDDWLRKEFTPAERQRMYQAANEESEARQQGNEPAEGKGLASLTPRQRAGVEGLQADAAAAFEAARAEGVHDAEALPSYVPRMVVEMYGGEAYRMGDAPGTGSAKVIEDIRTLPLATGRLREATAGNALINKIREIGDATDSPTVSVGGHPGMGGLSTTTSQLRKRKYLTQAETEAAAQGHLEGDRDADGHKWFTVDHPAFKKWVPEFTKDEETGKTVAKVDQNGEGVFKQVPIYVRDDFEGPLKSVLSPRSGKLYQGMMALKGKTMSVVMYSPIIHNAVEYGRALPAMPGKVATFKIYFEGNKAKNDPAFMKQAIDEGLVPIGHRAFNQDISGIVNEPTLTPGRSWTAKLAGAIPGLFDARAGDAVKRAVDKMGDVWHNTLLWDRVADLQMGLYKNFRDNLIEKGHDPQTAGRVAAHLANRYAGALPNEAMSKTARQIANFTLFSRSFTLGNLGAMKDMVNGLPRDLQAQILRDKGVESLNNIKSYARRKAIGIIGMDIALMYAGNSLLQSALNTMIGDKSLGEEGADYARRLKEEMSRIGEDPSALLNPFKVAENLSATSENEPGKKDRVMVGTDDNGSAIYARNPVGKIGEEFTGWITSPIDMVKRKLGTIVRPTLEVASNDKGFGRKVYDPYADTPKDWIKNMGRIASVYMSSQYPEQTIAAINDMYHGRGTTWVNAARAAGPFLGVTFSKGAPGGPAAGELYRAKAEHEFQLQEQMPEIRKLIKDGKEDEARTQMEKLGVDSRYQNFIIRTATTPSNRLPKRAKKDFDTYASPAQKERLERQQERRP